MNIAESALKIVAALFAWIVSKGIDKALGRWVAQVVVLYENTIQKGVTDGFRSSVESIRKDAPKKYEDWKQWRKSTTEQKK